MKFIITRTSAYGNDEQPCEEAVKEKHLCVDERCCGNADELSHTDKREWFSEGTNHRVENGHIKRDFMEETWVIEIPSLEYLMKLRDEYGEIIVVSKDELGGYDLPTLEIYDDWRE